MSDELKILIVDYKGINPAGALAKAMEAIATMWPDREPLNRECDAEDDETPPRE